MEYILNSKVLVLNKSYQPVNVTIVKDAIGLVYTDVANILSHDDMYSKSGTLLCNKYDNIDYKKWVSISESLDDDTNQFINSRVKHFKPKIVRLTSWNGHVSYYIRMSKIGVFNRDKGICQY
jgi:hypothetical protein